MTSGGSGARKHRGGESCPCEATDCPRHGDCSECIAFHRKIGDPTACERLLTQGAGVQDASVKGPVGDDFRLTDYASCAG